MNNDPEDEEDINNGSWAD